jgi:hypothetical protein
MGPRGKAQITLVLNSRPNREDGLGALPSSGASFVYGHFAYRRHGEMERAEYYAPFELTENNVVILGPPGERPATLYKVVDFDFLPPPCIPSTSLRGPD